MLGRQPNQPARNQENQEIKENPMKIKKTFDSNQEALGMPGSQPNQPAGNQENQEIKENPMRNQENIRLKSRSAGRTSRLQLRTSRSLANVGLQLFMEPKKKGGAVVPAPHWHEPARSKCDRPPGRAPNAASTVVPNGPNQENQEIKENPMKNQENIRLKSRSAGRT